MTETPIARAIILPDPANAATLVPALTRRDSLEARNARRILCQFDDKAVPYVLAALAALSDPSARSEGLDVLWTLLSLEDARTIRARLGESTGEIGVLMSDTAPLPDDMPEYIERDFRGRICDLAYIVIQELLNPEYDQSPFRGLDDAGRDQSIRQWLSSQTGGMVV